MSASSRHATRAAGIQDPPWEPLVSSAERQTPPGSDPAPAVIVVILLPRQGRRQGPRERVLLSTFTFAGSAFPIVIVVHLHGQPADMDAIIESCARHEVPLIEDAAESLGATQKGRHTGTVSRFGGMLLGPSAPCPASPSCPSPPGAGAIAG